MGFVAGSPVELGSHRGQEGNRQECLPVCSLNHQNTECEHLANDHAHHNPAEQEDPHQPATLILALVHIAQVVSPSNPSKHEPHNTEGHQKWGHNGKGQANQVHQQDVAHLKPIAGGARAVGQTLVTLCREGGM